MDENHPEPVDYRIEQPRIDKVSVEYSRKGRCAACGKGNVERTRTFTGATLDECQRKADLWQETPLLHRRCE